jgi:tetratricopeptide (TPR) repeat protein
MRRLAGARFFGLLSIVLLLAVVSVVSALPPLQDPKTALAAANDPDALFGERENLARARQAAELWAERADVDADAAWKLARASQWLGTHGPASDRRVALERGVHAGERAVALAPGRPEGHFWLAANMGTLAESFGLRQGLKYRGRIREELERVIALDPDWQEGSAEAALGRWYDDVPGLFGGSDRKAEEHLRRALAINPQSRTALTYLAELLIEHHRTDEARQLLERAVQAPIDPEWAPEDRELRAEAAARLSALHH